MIAIAVDGKTVRGAKSKNGKAPHLVVAMAHGIGAVAADQKTNEITYQEDKSLVRTGNAPRVMATLHSAAISILRPAGHANIAAANRHHARDPQRTLKLL